MKTFFEIILFVNFSYSSSFIKWFALTFTILIYLYYKYVKRIYILFFIIYINEPLLYKLINF